MLYAVQHADRAQARVSERVTQSMTDVDGIEVAWTEGAPSSQRATAEFARPGRDPGRARSSIVLAEDARRSPPGRASSPAGSASRSRRSRTSAAPSPTPASSAGSGRGSRSVASWPSSAGRTSRPSTRSRSSTRRAALLPTGSEETVQLAVLDGVEMTYLARHDGRQPVRLTSRHRPAPAGHRRRRPARPPSPRSTTPSSSAGSTASRAPGTHAASRTDARRAAGRPRRGPPSAATRWTTRRPSRASSATGSSIPGRQPGEGPYAASITLLKVAGDRRAGPGA